MWLFKQEPDCYSYADLVRDGSTTWDGVTNALALKHLRSVKKGDRAFFYHTGKEKAIVGIMSITSAEPVMVKAVKQLKRPVTLAEIKAVPAFAEWELVKNSRLSVMPVPDAFWKTILAWSEE